MKIIVNNEKEYGIIDGLCDLALKAGGNKNRVLVNAVMDSIERPKKSKNPKDETTK